MKNYKNHIIIALLIALAIMFIRQRSIGRQIERNNQTKKEIKSSQKQEQRLVDTVVLIQKQREVIKQDIHHYHTNYIDSKAKVLEYPEEKENDSVVTVTYNQLLNDCHKAINNCDSLVANKDEMIVNLEGEVFAKDRIITEKDKQFQLQKSIKPTKKRWGIGVIGGYGIGENFQAQPFVGVGISYNFLNF